MAEKKKNDSGLRKRNKNETKAKEQEPQEPTAGSTPQNPWKKLLTRVITGSCLITVLTAVMNSDHTVISIFVIAMQILSFKEILAVRYQAAKEKELPGFRTLNWFFLAATVYLVYGKVILLHLPLGANAHNAIATYHMLINFTLYCIGFMTFILTLKKGLYKYQMGQFTWTVMTLLTVIVQSHFMIKNVYEGIIWFLLPCAIIVCNDIFAYFCGFFFGRKFINKPFMSLSPNKTWEGFIGATFWTILFAVLFAEFLARRQWFICPRVDDAVFQPVTCTPSPPFVLTDYHVPEVFSTLAQALGYTFTTIKVRPVVLHSIVMAIFGSLIAPFGGFFASAIKRAYNKKDFDNIFPGHGGFTDRTDCQYIMGLFIYVYYQIFIKGGVTDLDTVYESALTLPLQEQMQLLSKLNETITQAIAGNAF